MDLARGLNTRISDAERIKAIYGSVLTGGSDERDMITVPPVGDDEREPPQFVSRRHSCASSSPGLRKFWKWCAIVLAPLRLQPSRAGAWS